MAIRQLHLRALKYNAVVYKLIGKFIYHLMFIGKFFFRIEFTRDMVAEYSSGATRDMSWLGNSVLNLFDNPKLMANIEIK